MLLVLALMPGSLQQLRLCIVKYNQDTWGKVLSILIEQCLSIVNR
jgi:hypothetical protein